MGALSPSGQITISLTASTWCWPRGLVARKRCEHTRHYPSLVSNYPSSFQINLMTTAPITCLIVPRPLSQGPATWSIINGEFNPSGRLPMAWPRTVGYVGTHVDSRFGPAGLWQGDYQGMGWRDNEPSDALFEYGFGLSFGTPDAFSFRSKENLTVPLSAATFAVRR
eukprot:SAG31_NODE_1354_length_8661_cov_170.990306_6_plen_167_part_00